MILGTGTDLCDIRRIERSIDRFGERFIDRIFTDQERERAERRGTAGRASRYAQLFAAKEACSKALGTGFREGVYWRDLEVVHLPSGKPTMRLSGGAKKRLDALAPEGMHAVVDVSLTDEIPFAQAIVIISALPKGVERPT